MVAKPDLIESTGMSNPTLVETALTFAKVLEFLFGDFTTFNTRGDSLQLFDLTLAHTGGNGRIHKHKSGYCQNSE